MMKIFHKKFQSGWWFSARADAEHAPVWYERQVFPWLSFTPWHDIVLGKISGYQEMKSFHVSVGWWYWRASLIIGRTVRVAGGEMKEG